MLRSLKNLSLNFSFFFYPPLGNGVTCTCRPGFAGDGYTCEGTIIEVRISCFSLSISNGSFCLLSRGGGVLPYRYVPPQRVKFLRRFGLKTDIDFAHLGLDSGTRFSRELVGVYKRIHGFNFK